MATERIPNSSQDNLLSGRDTDIKRAAIQSMLKSVHGVDGGEIGYNFYHEAVDKLSPASFRKHGLLGLLTTEFNGDIPLALVDVCLEVSQKPALVSQDLDTREAWGQREGEIDGLIRKTQYFKRKELIVGQDGEPVVHPKDLRRRLKKHKTIYAYGKYETKRDVSVIRQGEAEDSRKIIEKYILPGDVVCQLMSERGIPSLALVFGKVGRNGLVYCASTGKDLEDYIFEGFFDLFVNFPQVKGEEKAYSPIEQLQGETKFINPELIDDVQQFFVSPYLNDLDFYLDRYQNPEIKNLKTCFFLRYPLVPVSPGTFPLFREIRSHSVDVFIEFDRLANFLEARKEELVWEIDRVLKPGGLIILKEGSRAQTELEYYGEGIIDKYYSRDRVPFKLNHPGRWMVLRKLIPQSKSIENRATPHSLNKDDLAKEIYLAMQKRMDQSSSNGLLSFSWFKKNGFLSVLMTEFGGNIDRAIQYALEEKAVSSNTGTQAKAPESVGSSYTVSRVAKELGVGKAVVKRALGELGLRPLSTSRKGFSAKFEELRFSHQEYLAIKSVIEDNNVKQASNNND